MYNRNFYKFKIHTSSILQLCIYSILTIYARPLVISILTIYSLAIPMYDCGTQGVTTEGSDKK